MSLGSGIAVFSMWGCVALTIIVPAINGLGIFMVAFLALLGTIAVAVGGGLHN